MNTTVTFETAKLLKEKGFDEPCDSWYYNDGSYHDNPTKWVNSELGETNCSRPTIAEVIMWCFSKYNYSIEYSMSIPESGIYESGINSCVNGKQKSSKGFIWKRKNGK